MSTINRRESRFHAKNVKDSLCGENRCKNIGGHILVDIALGNSLNVINVVQSLCSNAIWKSIRDSSMTPNLQMIGSFNRCLCMQCCHLLEEGHYKGFCCCLERDARKLAMLLVFIANVNGLLLSH